MCICQNEIDKCTKKLENEADPDRRYYIKRIDFFTKIKNTLT